MKNLLALLFCSGITICVYAQRITVNGKVMDASGQPVAGASVKVKSSGAGSVTSDNGTFSVSANADDVLIISFTGYRSEEVAVNNRQNLSITLEQVFIDMQTVLVGTRRSGRVKLETPVPVDVISISAALPTGRMDISSVLNYAAPSFNYNKQSGSDGADHVDLATLRGLGPDQTLVLINGKRRHQTSFVAVFGTRGRGNSGTDLNAIPIAAIDRIEILRDGASAQYGSDAIAGVINIILKKTTGVLSGNVGYSALYDPEFNTAFKKDLGQYEYSDKLDGRSFSAGLNYGFVLGKKGGFINLSADYVRTEKTFRQSLDTADPLTHADGMFINPYRRANGDGSLKMGDGQFNLELPLQGATRFYSFGGYTGKSSDAFAFTRNFSARPDRFPTDAAGNMIPVPGIIKITSDGENYFNPHIQTKIKDAALSAGVKGVGKSGWNWDISNTIGYNRFHFFGDKTFNASVGASKTHFDDGGFSFLQNTANLNFSKEISGIASGFNLAFGAEYRYERYTIFEGEEASYKNYTPNKTVVNANGDVLNVAGGAQGFPGYQPSDVVEANRSNLAAYIDAELDVTEKWLLNGAIRVENYSDFGFTHNYKLATRLKATPKLNLRGSISTGYRAPSLQQINFSSTFTTVQGAVVAEVKIAPNYSPITKAAGIPELKQERSLNGSVGFTFNPVREFSVTVDGYWVRIKDRVVLSGQFGASDPDVDPALTAQMTALNVAYAQFFANAVNTTNKGIDVVLEYNKRWMNNSLKALFSGNFQDMTIDKINVPPKLSKTKDLQESFLTEREQKFILASAPKSKFSVNLEYGLKKFSVGTRLTYFGKVVLLGYGDGTDTDFSPPFSRGDLYAFVPADTDSRPVKDQYTYTGKLVTDLYASYRFNTKLTLYLGADNLFNVHPDLGVAPGAKYWAYNNEPSGPFDAVQMGGSGTRFFTRLVFQF